MAVGMLNIQSELAHLKALWTAKFKEEDSQAPMSFKDVGCCVSPRYMPRGAYVARPNTKAWRPMPPKQTYSRFANRVREPVYPKVPL